MTIFDDIAEGVSDAVDAIGDAGDVIGGILKSVSPVLAAVPGIGTAFSVAVYAAGAIAAKDRISDAAIGVASAAMPPGLPRIAFDGASNIARDVSQGRPVFDSAIQACRQAAEQAGGGPAVQAFDAGTAALNGQQIDQRLIDQGRAFALQSGGQAAASSYDAGVAIAQGKGADQVVVSVARGYVQQVGGPLGAAAFDTAIALGYGKTLQEANYIGLHTLVRGNDEAEKILNFVERVGRAASGGKDLYHLLEDALAVDLQSALPAVRLTRDMGPAIDRALNPYIEHFRDHLDYLAIPAGDLAQQWNDNEVLIRAAQALMRSGNGAIDDGMMRRFKTRYVAALGRLHPGPAAHNGPPRTICEAARDARARNSPAAANLEAQCKAIRMASIREGRVAAVTTPAISALRATDTAATHDRRDALVTSPLRIAALIREEADHD
jgi:hypothetical protein